MAYPERVLAEDEKVVKHLHPHWITLVPPIAILLVTAGLGSFLAAIVPDGRAHTPLQIAIGVVGVVVIVWFVVVPFLRWRTTHYVITTHRVLIRTGILNHTGHDIQLQRINDVGFEQTFWERIIRAGSLSIESASEHGQETLADIPRADDIQQLLNRLVEADSQRRGPNYRAPAQDWPTAPSRRSAAADSGRAVEGESDRRYDDRHYDQHRDGYRDQPGAGYQPTARLDPRIDTGEPPSSYQCRGYSDDRPDDRPDDRADETGRHEGGTAHGVRRGLFRRDRDAR